MKSTLERAPAVLERTAKQTKNSTSGDRPKRHPMRSLAVLMAAAAGTIGLMAVPALAGTGQRSPVAAQSAGLTVVRPAAATGFVVIFDVGTGFCIDLPRGNDTPGTGASEFICNGLDNQKFLPVNLGNSFFVLQNKANLLCLAARGNFFGARVIQADCNGASHGQWWQLKPVPEDPSHLWLANGFAGKCAQLDPGIPANGTPIDLGACGFDNRTYWHFV